MSKTRKKIGKILKPSLRALLSISVVFASTYSNFLTFFSILKLPVYR
jgi:hypothetical protein